ncbi:helix-turn-helix domain-containing protein [Streptomyces sp. NRRL F-5630]|uniref:helix-turn-helix domain-containing protein n=1 Tax=Streptomyces sp. NRRL F-5630 TaxID=1463864 RepID=UPI003EC0FBB5
MDQDWARLGRAFAEDRTARRLTQDDVVRALGVSRATVQNMERGTGASGKAFTRVTPTMRQYAQLLSWAEGSIQQVLDGGEPNHVQDASVKLTAAGGEPTVPAPTAGLPLRVAQELESDGPLLDTVTIPLPGGGTVVVVAKGKPQGTPAEIEASLRAWLRTQPQLQVLDEPEEEPPATAEG